MPPLPPAPVVAPSLTLSEEEQRRSTELERRARTVHRFCHLVNTAGRTPGLPRLARRAASRAARRIAEAVLPPLHERLLTPTIYGFDLCVSERSGKNYYFEGFFETGTLEVMRRLLRPGDVFVDAGASVGLMSLMASRLVGAHGRVLSFEPHPGRFEELTNSVAAAGAGNVSCYPYGLSSCDEVMPLFTERVSPSMVGEAGGAGRHERVRVVRLDDVLEAASVDRVHMLKIDVEGFELHVLQGALGLLTGSAPPVLCVEYGVYGEHPFIPFLEGLGTYGFFQLKRSKDYVSTLEPRRAEDLREHDNVFCMPLATQL